MIATNTHIQEILSIFLRQYPEAKIALRYSSPWELLVAVILSAQCTDKKVNQVTDVLFKKYPSFNNYLTATPQQFEKDIYTTGFFRSKTRHILNSAHSIADKYKGHVPKTLDALLTLPGVGRKTAHIVLLNAFGVVSGIPVDTHVSRISQRLKLVPMQNIGGHDPVYIKSQALPIIDYFRSPNTDRIESLLCRSIPKSSWKILSYQIIEHGRALCKAINPKCSKCPLSHLCSVKR